MKEMKKEPRQGYRWARMMNLWRITCAVLLALLGTSSVRADSVVIAPPKRSALVPAEFEDRIVEAIREHLSKNDKLRVIPPLMASEAVPDAHGCFTIVCILKYRETFLADFAVQISIFERDGRPSSFSVVLVESEEVQYRAGTLINSSNLEALAREVLVQARAKQHRGRGPWLIVRTQAGALVSVDEQAIGITPFEPKQIEPGDHVVTIKKDGFEPWTETLAMPEGVDEERVVDAQLRPRKRSSDMLDASHPSDNVSRATKRRQRRTWADWTLGLAGVAVGATYFIDGLRMTWRDGDCAEYGTQNGVRGCREFYAVTSSSKLRIAGGALGIAAGTAFAWGAPIGFFYYRNQQGVATGLTYRRGF